MFFHYIEFQLWLDLVMRSSSSTLNSRVRVMTSCLNISWLERSCGSFFKPGPLFTEVTDAMPLVPLGTLCPYGTGLFLFSTSEALVFDLSVDDPLCFETPAP